MYCNIMQIVILYNDMYMSYLYYISYILYKVFYMVLYYTEL